jgi:integrase
MSFTVDGKSYRKSTGTDNDKLARRIFDKVKGQIAEGKWFPQQQAQEYTFAELADAYDIYAKQRHKGYEKMTKSAIKKLKAHFGSTRLPISRKAIIDFQSSMLAVRKKNSTPLKPAYINRVISVLRSMFTYAVDVGVADKDSLDAFSRVKLKGEIKRLRFLSLEESAQLVEVCDQDLKPIVVLALNTGMRKGEILTLQWSQVDLTHNLILLDKTKNGERREVYISPELRVFLCKLPSRFKGDYVVPNPETRKPYANIKRMYTKALTKARIKDFRFHDLRHTFASQLVMAGVDLTTVKDLLGHKDIKMTIRYAHLAESHKMHAVKTLAARLWQTNSEDQAHKQAASQ